MSRWLEKNRQPQGTRTGVGNDSSHGALPLGRRFVRRVRMLRSLTGRRGNCGKQFDRVRVRLRLPRARPFLQLSDWVGRRVREDRARNEGAAGFWLRVAGSVLADLGEFFERLRRFRASARATSPAPGSSATSTPNCAASALPDETDRGRSSGSALHRAAWVRHNGGKRQRRPARGAWLTALRWVVLR